MAPHPQVAKLLIGAGVYLANGHAVPVLAYDWRQPFAWNAARGLTLPIPSIVAGRLSPATCGLLCAATLAWIGIQHGGVPLGIFASGSAIGGGLLIDASRRALIDMPALFFGLLALACTMAAIGALPNARMAVWWAAAAGLASGLAVSSKINYVLFSLACFAALALTYRTAETRRVTYACLGLLIWGSCIVFVVSNLSLYGNPAHGIWRMLSFLREVQQTP